MGCGGWWRKGLVEKWSAVLCVAYCESGEALDWRRFDLLDARVEATAVVFLCDYEWS